ncbi:MAG: hypothetical protein DRP56_03820 [Planctomycetota bacterium]|nr:MAG: hypothetical protein DRP56_03820 [Planctomycetota bacterium]
MTDVILTISQCPIRIQYQTWIVFFWLTLGETIKAQNLLKHTSYMYRMKPRSGIEKQYSMRE